ncbi:MAG: fibronectin type III domain-containing protein, partial [Gammaproteobacteria bacterium]|nr:fibronectin type III domain-containing protein [Gammaproteobacteria bacterium]
MLMLRTKTLLLVPVLALAFAGCGGGGGDVPAATGGSGGSADTTPPTNPTNLTASAAGSTAVDLSWQTSTDNVGVVGYGVERCQGAGCSTFAQVATPTGTSFTDTGLAA